MNGFQEPPAAIPGVERVDSPMKPVLFTSFSPIALKRQLACAATWRPHVAAIVTVNNRLEAVDLPGLPDWVVPFTYEDDVRTGSFRVPMHRFAEAIAALQQPADPVVLANSDVSLCTSERPFTACAVEDGLSFMFRVDVGDRSETRTVYDEGIDVFLFRARHHRLLPREPFCMGLPWWDFYLPVNFLRLGFPVRRLPPGPACHEVHPQRWDPRSFERLAAALIECLFPQIVRPDYTRREILKLCSMVQNLLVSRAHGESLSAEDLQRLHRRLDAWTRRHDLRQALRSRAHFHRAAAHILPTTGLLRTSIRKRHFRLRLEDGEIVTASLRRSAFRAGRQSVFVLGSHKAGSTLLNRVCRSVLVCGRSSVADIPGDLSGRGHDFHRVEQDLDGLFDQPGFCFGGFRVLPHFLRNSERFIRSPKLLLVRDPRDMLVSMYYSWAYSHPLPQNPADRERWKELRRLYRDQSIDEFVLAEAEEVKDRVMDYVWMSKNMDHVRVFRYEDIIFAKDLLIDALVDCLGISLSPEQRKRILTKHDIRPVHEDPMKHIRKVTPGDHAEKLSAETIRHLNDLLMPAHRAFGYRAADAAPDNLASGLGNE